MSIIPLGSKKLWQGLLPPCMELRKMIDAPVVTYPDLVFCCTPTTCYSFGINHFETSKMSMVLPMSIFKRYIFPDETEVVCFLVKSQKMLQGLKNDTRRNTHGVCLTVYKDEYQNKMFLTIDFEKLHIPNHRENKTSIIRAQVEESLGLVPTPIPKATSQEKKSNVSADKNTQFLELEIEHDNGTMSRILSKMHKLITLTGSIDACVVYSPWIPATEWQRLVMEFAIIGCRPSQSWSPFVNTSIVATLDISVDSKFFYLKANGTSGMTETRIERQTKNATTSTTVSATDSAYSFPIRQILETTPSSLVSESVRFMICSALKNSPLIIEYKLEDPVYKRWPSQTFFIQGIMSAC